MKPYWKVWTANYFTWEIIASKLLRTDRPILTRLIKYSEGGWTFFEGHTPSGIPAVALKKVTKKYPPTTGKRLFLFPSQDYQWNSPDHCDLRVQVSPLVSSLYLLCWYQEYLCPVETMYLSDERSITYDT